MESSLVTKLKIACVDTGYFVGLTPIENSKSIGVSQRDEFTIEMNQGMR
jgi:hypothetical protein